jgi:hypothetical protein
MKVSINHSEVSEKKGGMFSKAKTLYLAKFDVELNNEELAIIKARNLGPAVILSWNTGNEFIGEINVTVDSVIKNKGFGKRCPTPAEAKMFDAEGREALKNFKAGLEANSTQGKSDSFEL